MGWLDQVGGLLQQYAGQNAAAAPETESHFNEIAQAAPASALADGVAAAFRSDQTPPFGEMLSALFHRSTGPQQAGLLNTVLSAVGPQLLSGVLQQHSLGDLAGSLAGGQSALSPEQAASVPPAAVQQMAEEAVRQNPSVVEEVSRFVAGHPDLLKSLGPTVMSTVLSGLAQRHL